VTDTLRDLVLDLDQHGDSPLLTWLGQDGSTRTVTYGGYVTRSRAAAAALAERGVRRGDVVALVGAPTPDWYQAFAGIVLAGAIAAPLNPMYAPPELGAILARLRARQIVLGPGVRVDSATAVLREFAAATVDLEAIIEIGGDAGASAPDVDADSPAVILHTSGTTGLPKGAVQSHRNYAGFAEWWGSRTMRPDDVVLNFLSPAHQAGLLLSFLAPACLGAKVVQLERLTAAAVWSAVERQRCTVGVLMQPAPGILLSQTTDEVHRGHTLTRALGGSTPERQRRAMWERFGIVFTHEQMGSTETTLFTLSGSIDRPEPFPPGGLVGPLGGSSCGRPSPGWAEVRIADEQGQTMPGTTMGEIQVRGPGVFSGYLRDPAETANVLDSQGWFRTGDLGYIGTTGEVYWVDRIKALIRRSGENVSPAEIEAVLARMEGIERSAVFGVPDEVRGEEIMASIVPSPGAVVTSEQIVAFCREHLASYKVPRYLEICESLPLTITHRPRREVLRRDWQGRVQFDRLAPACL
jgi:acyl-CoA synthetase (AMP-forming)/AMP-acid ligase II